MAQARLLLNKTTQRMRVTPNQDTLPDEVLLFGSVGNLEQAIMFCNTYARGIIQGQTLQVQGAMTEFTDDNCTFDLKAF